MADALLIIDAQEYWTAKNPETTKRIAEQVDAVRGKMPVIWVYAQNNPADGSAFISHPPVQAGEHTLEDIPRLFGNAELSYKPVIPPAPNDWLIGKNQTDAFANPHLEPFLKKGGIDRLYIAGFMEGYCVYDTACSAAKVNVRPIVLNGLTADKDDKPDGGGGNFRASGIAEQSPKTIRPNTGPKHRTASAPTCEKK